ncbi:MAG TPA: RluA family pseudouridine synthase [Thermotogaceae bacterium]|nr:RluA family pseudouridine synthase [Thermotogaceae bacterium]
MRKIETIVDEKNYFRRLDKFLRKNYPQMKLASIYSLIRKGYVKVNGTKVKNGGFELNIGDRIVIITHEGVFKEESRRTQPIPMKLHILYEDERILAVDKPPGIAVHLGKNINKPTIIEGLMFYGKKNGFIPFIIHRLDKHTSGILIVAKDRESARILSEMFKTRKIKKNYLTLVKGILEAEGKIDKPIDGSYSLTFYRTLRTYDETSFLEVHIKTGRKHQIRKHMAFIGHPVVGDDTYGDWAFNRVFKKKYGLRRYFLHSYNVVFKNPFTGELISIESKLPYDLKEVLKRIEKNY